MNRHQSIGIDSQQGKIGQLIGADDHGRDAAAIAQGHGDVLTVDDHVPIGQQVAIGVDNHAAPLV